MKLVLGTVVVENIGGGGGSLGAAAVAREGTPFGPGIASTIAYLHGCQMIGFKRLTEVCQGLFGLTISQGAIANGAILSVVSTEALNSRS